MDADKIKYCKVFPGIGIARVGNSPDFFLGPECPGTRTEPLGGFKDRAGSVKRQAARFRLYAFDEHDQPLGELNLAVAKSAIEWNVALANSKAAWYEFRGTKAGMDTDSGAKLNCLRNRRVQDRSSLCIVPTRRQIGGSSENGSKYHFDDGEFLGIPVHLGELQTDELGRLIVLGGNGASGCTKDAKPISNYANNDYWYDDVSDGPVNAKVTLDGKEVPVTGAWIVVAPPDFAPFIENIVTLYDVAREATADPAPPTSILFSDAIFPIISRLMRYQWVNSMALRGHGPGKSGNFLDSDAVKQLRDSSPANAAFRKGLFSKLRNPRTRDKSEANYDFMPLLSGDEGDCVIGDPGTWLYLTESQYSSMERWANGDFVDDWRPQSETVETLEDLPIPEQPLALNRAALESCVGGAFFPGIEFTYIARDRKLYLEPFRLDANSLAPGDITKRMAIPWQADFFECQVHWWPAQRPDDVLNDEDLQQALTDFPYDESDKSIDISLLRRLRWDRGIGDRLRFHSPDDDTPAIPPSTLVRQARTGDNAMVEAWRNMGFIVPRTTPSGETLYVESGRSRYDGLPDREYFYMLLNIDSFPEFRPYAKKLAQQFLDEAWVRINQPASEGGVDDYLRFFKYSKEAFSQRLEQIYAIMLKVKTDAEKSDPQDPSNPSIPHTKEEVIERIRQLAPFNQLDGAWLRNISQAGPIDEINSLLFSVWMDEAGDGDQNQNHANLYTALMESVGIVLPKVSTLEYANNPDMLDSAYTTSVFELAISEFSRTFYPELLGMTLQLEWEVLNLWPGIMRLDSWGIDTHFYRMHVGIDNASNGHGAKARRAVELYLDKVANETGSEDEVQRQWQRIWTGYVAFETTGSLGEDFVGLLQRMRSRTPETDLLDLIERKKQYGQLNHGARKIGGQLINDLFEDPQELLNRLAGDRRFVIAGNPEQSNFFQRLTFDGPMYKVFTDQEIDLWREWVLWLPSKPVRTAAPFDPCARPYGSTDQPQPAPAPAPLPTPIPGPTSPTIADEMALIIQTLKPEQIGSGGHARNKLIGPDPTAPEATTEQSVTWWFNQPIGSFMSALRNPVNKWIVPGNPTESRFVTQLLSGDDSMADAFGELGPIPGRARKAIAIEWIEANCPLPQEVKHQLAESLLEVAVVSKTAFRLSAESKVTERARHPRGRILGIGSVH